MMMEGKRRRGRGRGGDGGETEGRRRGDGGVFMHRQRARDDKHLHELEGETELWMGIRIEEEIKKKTSGVKTKQQKRLRRLYFHPPFR